ncbi:MAG: hypothetical protein JWN98_1832, partial [Abditibacteriota bacterium]|nr:hypothetical protein [Abditibacteriota bacterium]
MTIRMIIRSILSSVIALLAVAGLPHRGYAQAQVLSRPRAIVLEVANVQNAFVGHLQSTLTRAGYDVQRRDYEAVLASDALVPEDVALVALPDARALPHSLHTPIEQFLKRGGDLIACGLPGWSKPLLRSQNRWIEAEEYARTQAAVAPAQPLGVLRDVPISQWARSSNEPLAGSTYEIVEQPGQGPVLHAVVGNLTSWDTISTPTLAASFAPGTDRTVFSAKGGPNSRVLSVEWVERDGSRWIAVVPLTPQWRRYELAPEAFRFYESNPQRGGANDRFRPENASRLALGIAFTHGESKTGRHEWWLSNLGTAAAEQAPLASLTQAASIDGLYPGYKSFRISDARIGLRAPSLGLFPMSRVPMPQGTLYSPHPRPSGAGFDKERHTRFVPLLEARSSRGNTWRGVPGALYIHDEGGRYRGGRWALFGITDGA